MAKKYTADFETTVDLNDCRVWAYAICEIGNPDNFIYGNSIHDFIEWTKNPKENVTLYFHNLKFDGQFIIDYLLKCGYEWIEDKKDRHDFSFTTLITDMGAFYSIEIYYKVKGHKVNKVTIYDSFKILSFKVADIARDFDLPIRKLDLDYKAKREIGHVLTPHEVDYIRNDVEIMARALKIMFDADLKKMTIGSDALSDFKNKCSNFKQYYPVLPIDVDNDIRRSYKGGFTYLNPKWRDKITPSGLVLDVNSLYPSRMYYEQLPFGIPEPFDGQYQKDSYYDLYIQKLSCSFKLKPNKIPSIQLKNTLGFIPNEYIESTDGELVFLTLTNPDLELFFEQYDVKDIEYHGGWKFKGAKGMFNNYIESWTKEKVKAKKEGNKSMYKIAKLMLNSLYGKFASSTRDIKKRPFLKNEVVTYGLTELKEKDPVYTAVASFITAYARRYTITTSQQIRDWSMQHKGFDAYVYSDTDSIHAILDERDLEELSKLIQIDPYILGAWDNESQFKRGKFLRQKCYIEDEIQRDGTTELKVTVAGFPKALANLVTFENFKQGFTTADFTPEQIGANAKLSYKRVEGGVVLVETDFTIK